MWPARSFGPSQGLPHFRFELRVGFDGQSALPELSGASRFAGALRGLAGVQIEKLPIFRGKLGWIFFDLAHQLVELGAGGAAAAEKRGHGLIGEGSIEEHVGILGRGCGRLIHQGETLAQGVQLGRPDREIPTAQGVGAAQIDAGQLIVRLGGQPLLERGDALLDRAGVPGQAACVERGDDGIVRPSQRAGQEENGRATGKEPTNHAKQWTNRLEKTNLSGAPVRSGSMLFQTKWRRPSRNIIAYTTHKAGSMVLHRVLKDICELNRLRYYSPNESKTLLPFDKIFAGHDFIARRRGCFGPLRFFVPTEALSKASLILHLRDPRDVLTSMFYSYCYMHAGEIEAHTGYRKEVAEAGIDRFVIDMVGERFYEYRGDYGIGSRYKEHVGTVRDRYERYLAEICERPNATVVSYEEMVLAFPAWLRKIVHAFDLPDPEETHAVVAARHANSVAAEEKEDVWSHKRKVTPGDHREKLKPETIRELDRVFGPVLEKLGYIGPAFAQTGVPVPLG